MRSGYSALMCSIGQIGYGAAACEVAPVAAAYVHMPESRHSKADYESSRMIAIEGTNDSEGVRLTLPAWHGTTGYK